MIKTPANLADLLSQIQEILHPVDPISEATLREMEQILGDWQSKYPVASEMSLAQWLQSLPPGYRQKMEYVLNDVEQLLKNEDPNEALHLFDTLAVDQTLPNEVREFLQDIHSQMMAPDLDIDGLEHLLEQEIGTVFTDTSINSESVVDMQQLKQEISMDLALDLSDLKIQPFHLGDPNKK